MHIDLSTTAEESGRRAAEDGARTIMAAQEAGRNARIILATGASQFDMLAALVGQQGIDWSRCEVFHLDEYLGMSPDHPASFVGYLKSRFVDRVPALLRFEAINGQATDPMAELARLSAAISEAPVDVAFIGIGENGHLAFNDPPALFDTTDPYLIVRLDQDCRRQQVSEGWFATLDDVPVQAITMSVPQILSARKIVCTVPDRRKAMAVRGTVEGSLSPDCPASALQRHPDVTLYLDAAAASLLERAA